MCTYKFSSGTGVSFFAMFNVYGTAVAISLIVKCHFKVKMYVFILKNIFLIILN